MSTNMSTNASTSVVRLPVRTCIGCGGSGIRCCEFGADPKRAI
jgi:hypothetical protein